MSGFRANGRPRDGEAERPLKGQALLFDPEHIAHTEAKDFFPTPVPDVVRFVHRIGWSMRIGSGTRKRGATVLDPSCGHGNIFEAVRSLGATHTRGFELAATLADMARNKGADVTHCDSLALLDWGPADYLIGNPPFSFALPFAERAAAWARLYQRPAALLLELPFAASTGRRAFHKANPSHMAILSKRIAFMSADGATAKADYAWFVWGPGYGGTWDVD